MKTINLKSALFIALTAGLLTSCVKDDDYDKPVLNDCTATTLVKNREVSDITAGATVALHQSIEPGVSDIIEAYVTSSDIGGNFFKSISFQTKPEAGKPVKAFSVPVDATNTFINFAPGTKVLINMDGLYTDSPTSGPIGMRIGSLYVSSTASVGRMPEADFKKSVQPSCTVINEDELLPLTPVNIADITQDNSYLNRLVELNNVEFSTSDINDTYYDVNNDLGGATNRTLMDIYGNTIIFRTSAYANFAAKTVPVGSGKVRGIVTKYGSDFQFMVRSIGDVKLSNEMGSRFNPLLNESFSQASSFSNWTSYSVLGAEVWTYSATFGNPGGMAKMSGYNGTTNKDNEDWLISSPQNLSSLTNATLSFDNAYKFTGNPIEVLVSNNYTGSGNPNSATWTTLTPLLSAGNYNYVNSGDLDISAYTGAGNTAVYIAFKYTSTSSAASTWEIDNVKIKTN